MILLTYQADSSVNSPYFLNLNGGIVTRTVIDHDNLQQVCVLGSVVARQLFPYQDPLGEQVLVGTAGRQSVLLTVINVVRSLKKGPIAGPDPWKGNTLEWFTPSPPPENNFDVVPRVRSVEPMKDIRRQIERQTGVPQRFEAGKPMVRA